MDTAPATIVAGAVRHAGSGSMDSVDTDLQTRNNMKPAESLRPSAGPFIHRIRSA